MKNKGGRPTKMTDDTINKLEHAFSIGASDEEACFYADISTQTLYTYQKKNKKFLERKEALKINPVLQSRQVVIKEIIGEKKFNKKTKKEEWIRRPNAQMAMSYLEKKRKSEFGNRIDVDLTHDINQRDKNLLEETLAKINELNKGTNSKLLQDGTTKPVRTDGGTDSDNGIDNTPEKQS